MLKPGDVALDCGTNIGAVTQVLSQTGADVHAFEPNPYAYGALEQAMVGFGNVALHKWPSACKPERFNRCAQAIC